MLGALTLSQIPTSRSLVVQDRDMLPAETGSTVSTMSPGQSALAIFSEMRDILERIAFNTDQTVENIKTLVIGNLQEDQLEDRRESIERGETDKPKGPGVLKRVGGALQKVNPFSEEFGFGNIGRLILFGAGLLALNLFGDKLIDPLAGLLETIKTGKTGDKIMEIVTLIKEKIDPIITELKDAFNEFLLATTIVKDAIIGIYTAAEDYISQFDVDGIEGLSKEEQDALLDDIQTRIAESIMGVFSKLLDGLTGVTGIFTLLTTASILKFFAKRAPVLAAGTAAGAAGLGLFGTAAIVAIAAAGIYALYDRIQFALNDELDNTPVPDNIVDRSSNFMAKFLGGPNPEGGAMNALTNAGTMGLIGAVMGGIIGSFFGGVGAIPGATIGFRIGSLLGAGFGFVGSDELLKDMPSMENARENTDKLLKFFTGRPTDEDISETAINEKLQIAKDGIVAVNKQLADPNIKGAARDILERSLKNLQKTEQEALTQLDNLPYALADRATDGGIRAIDDEIANLNTSISSMKSDVLTGNLEEFEVNATMAAIKSAENQIVALQGEKDLLAMKFNTTTMSAPLVDTGDIQTNRIIQESMAIAGGSGSNSFMNVSDVQTNSNNTAVTNNSLGGMTVGNPDYETEVLIKGIR